MTKALIIVDMQNDFLPGGALAVPNGDQIIEEINYLSKNYDLVVASQDWHPADHGSFASQHEGKQPFEMGELAGLPQVFWPDHCVQSTPGAALTEALDQNSIEAIFRKGMDPEIDSYSAFFDNGMKKATGLEGYLKDRKVDEVHICGLAADFCVMATAKDALKLGFASVILQNATKAIDQSGLDAMYAEFEKLGGSLL
ncbi:MAG: bifunctional nicotinamidase/pyrazinamidase [Anaerolineaceae bacterium]|nr:bifunctional nicotinamidase/pyrazinamidase [Anaerolineaceae bacterium]